MWPWKARGLLAPGRQSPGRPRELLVVHAQHIKTVPGRKTEVKDTAWITWNCRAMACYGSFIPSKSQRQLRELVVF